MDVPLDVDVYCTDGKGGRSTAIIVERAERQVTHFAVGSDTGAYLVPVSAIAESTPTRITLKWSRAELAQAEPFVVEVPATPEEMEIMASSMTQSGVLGPYTTADAAYMANYLAEATVPEEQVKPGAVAIHVDDEVQATDGRAGRVDELLIDATGHVTHLVLRTGHLWGKRDVFVPLELVDHAADDVIYLKLDKRAIEQLPAVTAPKK